MPLFPPGNLCFVHIPKTGGTSVEQYLKSKYNVELNGKTLYMSPTVHGHTRQHCTLREIRRLSPETLDGKYRIFSIVRHPYERTLSDLYYWGLLKVPSPAEADVLDALRLFWATPGAYDNHALPQLRFLIDKTGDSRPSSQVTVLRTETLTHDMRHKMGFQDFEERQNTNRLLTGSHSVQISADEARHLMQEYVLEECKPFSKSVYGHLLTERVRKTIYEHYAEDFYAFDYSPMHLDPPHWLIGQWTIHHCVALLVTVFWLLVVLRCL